MSHTAGISLYFIQEFIHNSYTVTRKGNATHIWKVADIEFLYLSTKLEDCLGVKSKLVARTYLQ